MVGCRTRAGLPVGMRQRASLPCSVALMASRCNGLGTAGIGQVHHRPCFHYISDTCQPATIHGHTAAEALSIEACLYREKSQVLRHDVRCGTSRVPNLKQSPAVMARSTINTDPPEGGDAEDPLCQFPSPLRPMGRSLASLLEVPSCRRTGAAPTSPCGQQLLLLCQQGLNVALNLQERGQK